MSNDSDAPAGRRRSFGKASTLARFALIGVALAAVASTFAYLGGWFSSNELTPARFTDGFEEVNGVHSGFRRNHAKGVGVSGFFEGNGNGPRGGLTSGRLTLDSGTDCSLGAGRD